MSSRVGVVAIQGDFERHTRALLACGVPEEGIRLLKSGEDLDGVDRVIVPGGESTTVGKLMERFGLGPSLIEAAKGGMPIWGTCMGMILMAQEIEDYSNQYRLNLLDVTVRRNAFGAQVHSFEADVELSVLDSPLRAVFIRAPVVTRLGEGVECLGTYEEHVVAVRQGNLLGTSFHPELTDDRRLHEWFLQM